jgi:hypothetical protein
MDREAADAPTLVNDYHALKTVMNTTFKEVMDSWSELLVFDDDHTLIDFAIDDVKWYESYPDVAAFMAMLDEVQDLGYEYEFIRVGEDNGDIESHESNNHNGYLSVCTTINCNF